MNGLEFHYLLKQNREPAKTCFSYRRLKRREATLARTFDYSEHSFATNFATVFETGLDQLPVSIAPLFDY